jgi:DNA-binding transcriptional LysR family regulator
MQRLEAVVGHSLLLRSKGGGVELTAQGQYLVERSRELLALNDEIVQSLHVNKVHRSVRLGADGGYSRPWIPAILARFAAAYPEITVEMSRDSSCELVAKLKAGDLDLGSRSGSVHNVDLTAARDLVGDLDRPALRVVRIGPQFALRGSRALCLRQSGLLPGFLDSWLS